MEEQQSGHHYVHNIIAMVCSDMKNWTYSCRLGMFVQTIKNYYVFIEKVVLCEAHYTILLPGHSVVTFYSIPGCECSYLSYSDVIKT